MSDHGDLERPSALPAPDAAKPESAQAARSGDVVRLKALLDRGIDADSVNNRGDSLLMLAAYHGHIDAVRMLLGAGADPNLANAHGQHPLAGVCHKGFTEVARLMLEHGSRADGAAGAARTPLMYAAMRGHIDLVKLLLEHGADPALRDRNGHSALDLARQMRAVYTVPLLEARDSSRD